MCMLFLDVMLVSDSVVVATVKQVLASVQAAGSMMGAIPVKRYVFSTCTCAFFTPMC